MSWSAIADEGIAHLRRMIQIDTINPPGNELALARYLETVLSAEGIDSTIVEATTSRGAIIARLRGDGRLPPILMTAHLDVVGVERAEWSVDPLGGEVHDGRIYGRGAIDDKGMLAAELMTMLVLRRRMRDESLVLARDVIFAGTADEEAGGAYGIQWLIQNHPDLIRAEFAINEGGRIRMVGGRPAYAAIQNAEKVSNVVQVTARGTAGHAAIPLADNPLARLARAIALISAHREKTVLLPTTREFFAGISRVWPDRTQAAAMIDVASADDARMRRGSDVLAGIPLFDSVLRNGISATMLNAGVRHNVIPARADATLSIRTLPGEHIGDVVQRLRALVDDPMVDVVVVDTGVDAPSSSITSPMFLAIRDAIVELEPSLVVVPYLSTGATESARLRAAGTETYGLLPFPLDEDDERRMHGADERLALPAFEFGVKLLHNVIGRTQEQSGISKAFAIPDLRQHREQETES